MKSDTISWGIIGCGEVTEKKSGPAFNKVPHSKLVAVMRRNAEKASDYARRHGVPRWYSDSQKLIADPEVNAVYIATPPDSHLFYTKMALEAGKPVYVEKPMALNSKEAIEMELLANESGNRIVVAHYRRYWPQFIKVKQLLNEGAIGKPLRVQLVCARKPLTAIELLKPGVQWRINPALSGGGLFHDLAPHQLDLLLYWFGEAKSYAGFDMNHGGQYSANDTVARSIHFNNGVDFFGLWHFAAPVDAQEDYILMEGDGGTLRFSVFWHNQVILTNEQGIKTFSFDPPENNQIYLIERAVNFFRGEGENPCSASDAVITMKWIDAAAGYC